MSDPLFMQERILPARYCPRQIETFRRATVLRPGFSSGEPAEG